MATATATSLSKLESILGKDAQDLLEHECKTIPKSQLHLPGPDFITRIFATSDRPTRVLRSLESLFDHGRLAVRCARLGRSQLRAQDPLHLQDQSQRAADVPEQV